MSQTKNALDKTSLIKIIKGALIAGGGVAAIYLLESVANLNLGQYTAIATGLAAVLINAIKEIRKGQ